MRAREPCEQGRFAGVGQPDQSHVCDQLQRQGHPGLVAGEAALGEPRRLVSGTGEALVSASSGSAARDHGALAGGHEIVAGAVGLDRDLGPERHADLERLSVATVAQRPLPMARAPRLEMRTAPERLQVAQRFVGDHDHVAAATAVAAVGSALGHVSLAAEAQTAVAAAAGLDVYARSILHRARRYLFFPPRHLMPASDPVFLITGASSGIGAATARRASEAGYRLAL